MTPIYLFNILYNIYMTVARADNYYLDKNSLHDIIKV